MLDDAICSFLDTALNVKLYIVDNSLMPFEGYSSYLNNDKIEYVYLNSNRGFGAGHNVILRQYHKLGKYHIILNPDIRFEKGVLETLFNYMEKHPDIGNIMPKVIYPDGNLQYLCKLLPTPMDIIGRKFLPKSWTKKRNDKYEMHFTEYNKIRNCPILSGCFMFLNVNTIKKNGVFDERFFMYFEDFDLMRRIHQISKTVYYPNVSIIHAHASEHRTNKLLLKMSIKSAIMYFNKWGWFFDKDRNKINKEALSDKNIIHN